MKIKISELTIRREIKKMKTAMNSPMGANAFICHHAAVNALEWVTGNAGAIVPSQLAKFADDITKSKRSKGR